jgi:hypothetical protein
MVFSLELGSFEAMAVASAPSSLESPEVVSRGVLSRSSEVCSPIWRMLALDMAMTLLMSWRGSFKGYNQGRSKETFDDCLRDEPFSFGSSFRLGALGVVSSQL